MSDLPQEPSAPSTRRKRSARFSDIAAEAGVSETTVNRVLNERGSVSAATRARVVAAARRLGVPRLLPEPRRGLTRFDVILAGSGTPYFQRLNLAFQRAMHMLDKKVVIHRTLVAEGDGQDERIARAILSPRQKRHGLIVAVHDSITVRAALRQVIHTGVPVVTLMSDIADVPRLHYAGIDNYRAGRTAGHFLGRALPAQGRILLISNALQYQAHAERIHGVQEVLAERYPGLLCGEVRQCHDQPDRCHAAVARAIKAWPDLVGIYNSGAGSAGIVTALRQTGKAGQVLLAGHELSAEHRLYLEQGEMELVIDQDPDWQTTSSLQHLLYACGRLDESPSSAPNEFRLFCRENIGAGDYLPP